MLRRELEKIKPGALGTDDKVRFCIGFAIDGNGWLQKTSCANDQAFGAGRELPSAQYDKLFDMLSGRFKLRCHKKQG